MGAEVSTALKLKDPFTDIAQWEKNRVLKCIKQFKEGQYDSGISRKNVEAITGLSSQQTEKLFRQLRKQEKSYIINPISMLCVIVTVGNSSVRDEFFRVETLFDIMDYSSTNKLTYDELIVLMVCIRDSYKVLTGKSVQKEKIIQCADSCFSLSSKEKRLQITKEDFLNWCKAKLFDKGASAVSSIVDFVEFGFDQQRQDTEDCEEESG